jgi:tRNA threonylcarbamoyladenosine biosynthesis protein TsaB
VNILAFDTSTEACSAALLRYDEVVFSEFEIAPRQHQTLLPQMVDSVLDASGLKKTDITYCAFTNGPGAFTGIRIAAARAQGIGIALNIPLLPISTLALLAQTTLDRMFGDKVLVALDARMNEIYWAVYERSGEGCASLIGVEQINTAVDIEIGVDIEAGAGPGWIDDLRMKTDIPVNPELFPDARSMFKLTRAAVDANAAWDASQISINYLRNQVAVKASSS